MMNGKAGSGVAAPWLRGRWARRTYALEAGWLRPVPGSVVEEYDPRNPEPENEHKKNRRELLDELMAVNPDCEASILAFVNRWGILGLFQHYMVHQICLQLDDGRILARHDPPPDIEYTQVVIGPDIHLAMPHVPAEADPETRGASLQQWLVDEHSRGLVFTDLPLPRPDQLLPMSLASYYQLFFPGPWKLDIERLGFPYAAPFFPDPHSAALWDELSEHATLTADAIREYQRAAQLHDDWASRGSGTPPAEFTQILQRHLRKARLVVAHSGSRTAPPAWRLESTWFSLLGCAYMLLWEQISGGRAPRRCANEACGRWFTPTWPGKKYHHPACGNRQSQRTFKRKQRMNSMAAAAVREG